MLRLKIQLPPRHSQPYSHYDLLHDAIINALIVAGASPEMIIGEKAKPWTFAALGRAEKEVRYAHTLIISTTDQKLANYLAKIKPAQIKKTRGYSQERIDFSEANISIETDPIPPIEGIMNVLLLSPLLIRDRNNKGKQWHTDFNKVELAEAVNHRLSRLAQREVKLMIQADPLYLRANPKHASCITVKKFANGKRSFVLGLQAPLVLAGSEEDLRFAWYAGIGEKNRNGFGCLGLLEQGVGR
ncbi:MAG: CRISPR-associated protein Cas6 [Thiotrichaceae bacterium]|nr:CRISPR-associated protein Cas6 [Thiotrichaceae bacterium]